MFTVCTETVIIMVMGTLRCILYLSVVIGFCPSDKSALDTGMNMPCQSKMECTGGQVCCNYAGATISTERICVDPVWEPGKILFFLLLPLMKCFTLM